MNNILVIKSRKTTLLAEMLMETIKRYEQKITLKCVNEDFVFGWSEISSITSIILFDDIADDNLNKIHTLLPAHIPLLILETHELEKISLVKWIKLKRRFGIISTAVTIEEFNVYVRRLYDMNEGWFLSNDIQQRLLRQILVNNDTDKSVQDFTTMEQQLIELGKKGYSIRQTADILELSPNTVAVYRSRLLKKSGAKSIAQLVSKYR